MIRFRSSTILAFTMFVMVGCSRTKKDAPARIDSIGRSETPSIAPHSAVPADSAVSIMKFDEKSVPPEFVYPGKLLKGARWIDRNGDNSLIVSQKFAREGDETVQSIYGTLWTMNGGVSRLLWKIEDNARNYCDKGVGLASDIVVEDIDGDGIAENAFVYNVQGACDVSAIPYKLMLHSGGKKFAVRGEDAVLVDSVHREGGVKNFDAAFDTAPKGFREFASKLWDSSVP